MSRLPIRLRLVLAVTVSMLFLITAAGTFLYLRLGADLSQALNLELRQRAQDLEVPLSRPATSLNRLAGPALIEQGESFAQVLSPNGRVYQSTHTLLGKSLLGSAELTRAAQSGTYFADRSAVPGLDEPARLLVTPISYRGQAAVLVVGATLQNRAEALSSLSHQLLLGGPLVLLATAFGGYLLAGAALHPVESMRRSAANISTGELSRRLPTSGAHDELDRLSGTLNDLLDRLEAAILRERAFVGAASHDLRTPLAVLKTELELALRHSRAEWELEATIRSSVDQVDRLTRLANDLLFVAQSDQTSPRVLQRIDTAELIRGVADTYARLADQHGRTVHIDLVGSPAWTVMGDRVQLERALRNLIANGLEHGEGELRLGICGNGNAVELHVTDQGPGFPPDFLEHAFEKFTRPDPSRSGRGTGLGLAIVQAVARSHRGTAFAANRAAGGADVWLVLPLAPTTSSKRQPTLAVESPPR